MLGVGQRAAKKRAVQKRLRTFRCTLGDDRVHRRRVGDELRGEIFGRIAIARAERIADEQSFGIVGVARGRGVGYEIDGFVDAEPEKGGSCWRIGDWSAAPNRVC